MMMSIQQQKQQQHISVPEGLKRAEPMKEELPLKKRKIDATTKDEDIFPAEVYNNYINTALESLEKQKDHLGIDRLTSQINLPLSSVESLSINSLSIILQKLSQEISRIDNKHCQGLILSLINLKAVKYKDDYQFIKSYQFFITVLVSGIPKWWNEVSTKIISDFIYDGVDFYHEILQKILYIIPTSINTLQRRVSECYPNKNNKKKELVNYVKNLLNLNEYCNELKFQNWCIIVENCIKLDVELQNELEELDEDEDDSDSEEEEEEEEEEDEDEDEEEDEEDEEEDDDDGDEDEEVHTVIKTVSNLSSKLDSIMVVLLEKTTISLQDLSNGDGVELYNILSSLFKSHILPTHLTRCIQYLIFNLATRHEQLMDSFLYLLIEVSFQQQEILSNRIKSMQYISSFIARCKNLPRDKLVFVTSFLISWMNRFIQEREVEVDDTTNLLEKFKLFYHCFQTLIYIYCFKHKQLKKEDGEWECGIDKFFQKAIITKFNPLKYSNENVVKIFADLSAQEDLCYCFSILDKIKRDNYGLNHEQMNINDLNGYFPFDPLMLKHSKKLIQDNYIDWQDEDDDEDEEL